MKRIPAAKKYNARGERWCIGCRRHLHLDSFSPCRRAADGLRSRCRGCHCRQQAAARNRRYADATIWRRDLDRQLARAADRAEAKRAEQRSFMQSATARLREQGFSLDELEALAGLDRHLLAAYDAGRLPRFFRRPTIERMHRLLLATGDLPRPGRIRRRGRRPPHPALDLVRARLARMDYLAELEAA